MRMVTEKKDIELPATYYTDRVKNDFIHLPYYFVRVPRTASYRMKILLGQKTMGHYSANTYTDLVGADEWAKKYSFAFVRNPFDRLVSWYCLGLNLGERVNHIYKNYKGFNEWVINGYNHHWVYPYIDEVTLKYLPNPLKQTEWVLDVNKNIAVNFIGRYENIENDSNKVLKHLNMKSRFVKNNNSNHDNYRSYYYYRDTIEFVRKEFKEDLDLFNYDF